MVEDCIIAGFGGQGVMRLGQMLAYSGLREGKNVLWMPAYGPETRGGFANCTVIISDEEIGSPVVSHPRSLIVMNRPSLDKFEEALQPGGVLVVNTSMCDRDPERKDVRIVKVPATEIATKLGNQKAANMVALGAFLEAKPIVTMESLVETLKKLFKDKLHVVPINEKALTRGSEVGKEQLAMAK